MKQLLIALLAITTITATASEQTEIKAYLATKGITATAGNLRRAVRLLDTRQKTYTTTTNTVARDALKVAQELQVQYMVNTTLATNVPLPYTKAVTTQVMGTLNYLLDASTTLAELKNVTKLQGNLLALKAELGGDLTYADFGQASNTTTSVSVDIGDTFATLNLWADYLAAKNKIEYLREVVK